VGGDGLVEPGGNLFLNIFLIHVFDIRLDKLESIGHLSHLADFSIISLLVSIEDVFLN
jgi:hypothetical protein